MPEIQIISFEPAWTFESLTFQNLIELVTASPKD